MKQRPRREVAGILDPRCVAGCEEEARGEIGGLLDAARQDDLIGSRAYPSRGTNVARDGFTEWAIAGAVAVGEQRRPGAPGPACVEPRPRVRRKQIERRFANAKGHGRGAKAFEPVGRFREGNDAQARGRHDA